MFYSKEQCESIIAKEKVLHSTREHDVSLCQYKGKSCVRCCLPHIGGDSHMEISNNESIKSFNANNLRHHLRYGNRYVGFGGILMKFRSYHPLRKPKFEVSHYEDSFEDVGQEEMERRFSGRTALFSESFDSSCSVKSLETYVKAIHDKERYNYDPESNKGG